MSDSIFYSTNDTDDHQVISIGVGLLPLVKIGSLWHKGRCININVGRKYSFKLTIDPSTTQEVKAGFKEDLNKPYKGYDQLPIIPPFAQFLSIKGLKTNCITVKHGDDPYGIIVPIPVLISSYYATSTDLSLAVFNGDFQHNINGIINPRKSCIDEGEDICSLHLRKHIDSVDGWIISRILFNTEARKGVRRIHDSLMKQRAEMDYQWLHPQSNFPFHGDTELTVYCKPIKCSYADKWRYLVYDIVSCSAPFPFSRLEVDRDNNNNPPKDPNLRLPDHERIEPFKNKTRTKELSDKPFKSEQEPSADGPIANLELPGQRFTFLRGKEIEIAEKNKPCRYKSAKVKVIKDIIIDQQSTGKGTYGATTAIQARIRAKALKANFKNFISAIEYLNTYSGVRAKVRPAIEGTEYLPLAKNSQQRQWAYLNSKAKTRRSVLIADVEYQGINYTLIDFQGRKDDHFPISIISQGNGWPISNQIINILLFELSKALGRWNNIKNIPENISSIQTMRHSWHSEEIFCKNFLSKIKTQR